MLGRVVGGKLIIGLPTYGKLNDGTSVSNYHLLPTETLADEGWKTIEEIKPTIGESQHLERSGYVENDTTITVSYVAVDNPATTPDVEERLTGVETTTSEIVDTLASALGVTIE